MTEQNHPLSNDLTQLTLDDLEKRITQLTQRWYTAKRMNMDYSILYQLDLLLQGLEYEKMRRIQTPIDNNPVVIDTDAEPKNK